MWWWYDSGTSREEEEAGVEAARRCEYVGLARELLACQQGRGAVLKERGGVTYISAPESLTTKEVGPLLFDSAATFFSQHFPKPHVFTHIFQNGNDTLSFKIRNKKSRVNNQRRLNELFIFLLVTILYKLFYMYNNIVGQPVLFSVLLCFWELNRATFDINKERETRGQERMMGRGND